MRQCIVLLTALLGLICCTTESNTISNKHTLLTSSKWTIPLDNKDENHLEGIWSFNNDGTYIENFGAEQESDDIVTMTGSWQWVSENEISILYHAIITNDNKIELGDDNVDRFVLKIIEVSHEKLKVVKRHTGDSENSRAIEVTYIATTN